jgi:Tol biopolymer transport system component
MKLLRVTLVLAMAALLFAQADSALEKAIRTETLEGNLKGAIEQYKKLAQGKDRAVAAKALVRMGQCYEKLGDAESRKAYERVVREFADQKEAVEEARKHLAAAGKPASGLTPRLIGKDGWVLGPSLDGRFLLQYGTTGDLDLRDLQTGQIRHIAKQPWYSAGVSPDGRQVAFFRRTNDTRELRIVGADGSAERLLWQADKEWGAWGVQWFPDGKRIMVTVWQAKDRRRLVAISATDGAVTTLWEGKQLSDPQLSPDGKSVVYTRRVRENPVADELWLLRLEDRSEVLLFEGQSLVEYPRWTPDGTGVVFLSDRRVPGATVDLWLLRTSGGKPLGFPQLVKTGLGEMENGEPTTFPSGRITRDGTYYFHREKGELRMAQLLTTKFDPDTGKAVGAPSFVSRKGALSRSPSFSRDGRWLAYLWQNPGSLVSLVIQSVESGEERFVQITPSPVKLGWAVMFPDGRSVLVMAVHPKDGNGIYGIYRVDAANGAWTSLKKPGEREVEGFPNGISPDGRTLYLNRWTTGAGNREIVHLIVRDMETGQERELRNGEGAGVFALSHDGKQLAVAHPDGKDLVIDVLPAAGGPKREVYRVQGFQGADIWWTPDGRYLIFVPWDKFPKSKAYMRVPVEGGEAQPIGISASQDEQVQFPRSFGAVRVHPNGRQLVYTARGIGNEGSGDWALENFLPKTAK